MKILIQALIWALALIGWYFLIKSLICLGRGLARWFKY